MLVRARVTTGHGMSLPSHSPLPTMVMFREADLDTFGAVWESSSSQIRALSEKEVEGQWPWDLKPSKVLLLFLILFCSPSHFSPPCSQCKSPTKRLLFLSLYGDYKRIELPLNACLNIFMCYNLNTHYKATQNSCRCHRLLISAMQFEKAYGSVSKIFISHRWGLQWLLPLCALSLVY